MKWEVCMIRDTRRENFVVYGVGKGEPPLYNSNRINCKLHIMLTGETFRLEETVRLYEPCNVLLCLICRAGIKPGKGVASHFRNRHKLTGEELQAVLSFASRIPYVSDPATVELPHDGSVPMQDLPRLKGYSCMSCRHLTVNKKNAITHQTAEGHTPARRPGWTVVTLQSFGRRRQARYWVVAQDGSVDDSGSTEEGQLDGLATAVRACEEVLAKEAHERRMKVEEPGGPDVMSRWVEHMKWTVHLQKRDRATIRAAGLGPMTAAAERKERNREKVVENKRLRVLADSFERELRRCAQRIDRVPTQSLKWLASVDPTKPVGEPFRMKDKDKTWDFYCGRYQQYLCYCARVAELGRSRARREHGVQFNNEQWRALHAMVRQLDGAQDGGEEALAALDRAVFAFCICSIKQKLSKWAYVSPLLHFTSVLAIDVTGQTWMPAHSFTRHLAGFLWCSRVLMLEQLFAAYDDGQGSRGGSSEDSNSADSSSSEFEYSCSDTEDDVAAEAISNFQEGRRAWLADGSYAVISTIIEWMSYGHGHRLQEYGLPRLAWEDDKKTVNFEGSRIRVADFQGAAQHAAGETERLLDGLMDRQWAQVRETIELGDIADSLIYEGPGRSFATNRKNLWLQPGAGKLTQLVGSQLWRPVETEGGRVVYECRRQATEEFLLRLKRFRGALFVSLHVWAGQPGRGPEMATLKHCDTEELPRNVFVFDGQVVLITDRDKQKRGRKVARWLPQDLSKVMVAFVAWLLPFEKVLHRLSGIKGLSETLEPWLFKDTTKGLWQTDDLSRRLDLLTSAQLGVRLTVASYRHVAIEFGRQIKGLVIRQSEMDGVEVDEHDEWIDPQTGETRLQPQVDYIWDLQSTHGSRVARHHYALSLQYPDQLQPEMLLNYHEVSRLWHEFLGRSDGEFGRKRDAAGSPVSAPEPKRVCTARQTVRCHDKGQTTKRRQGVLDIDAGLRKLFGPAAQWKSGQQRKGMETIMALQDNGVRSDLLILVLPTGGGKSVFFLLPSLVEDEGLLAGSTSIVVVPFSALMKDLVGRARSMGIDCVWWRPAGRDKREERRRDARLVIVSADVAVSEEFVAYVGSIRSRDQLQRIFFDECHTIITDVSYRAQLGKLKELHRFGCPMVMLTATLPVKMEPWFREQMLCKDAAVLRASAVKQNIRYRVDTVEPGGTAVRDRVMAVMQEMEQRMAGGQKGVVYCRSIAECEALGEQAGCDVHHSNMTEDAREAALRAWMDGRDGKRWIVATSGLGTGVDIGGIVGVVHMRQPYGLVDFVQQTGRGGRREGEVVDSVIVTDGRPLRENEFASDIEKADEQAIKDFMQPAGCRRVVLGQFMDGEARSCDELGAERCDRCRAAREEDRGSEEEDDSSGLENRLKEHRQQVGRGITAMYGWLDEVAGPRKCSVCYIKWHIQDRPEDRRDWYKHERATCRLITQSAFEAWRRPLRFADYRCCWECGLPHDWCMQARVDGRCRYRNHVLPVVMMAGTSSTLRQMVSDEFGINAGDDDAYRAWLVRSRPLYDRDMTNALAVWDLIIWHVCIQGLEPVRQL